MFYRAYPRIRIGRQEIHSFVQPQSTGVRQPYNIRINKYLLWKSNKVLQLTVVGFLQFSRNKSKIVYEKPHPQIHIPNRIVMV